MKDQIIVRYNNGGYYLCYFDTYMDLFKRHDFWHTTLKLTNFWDTGHSFNSVIGKLEVIVPGTSNYSELPTGNKKYFLNFWLANGYAIKLDNPYNPYSWVAASEAQDRLMTLVGSLGMSSSFQPIKGPVKKGKSNLRYNPFLAKGWDDTLYSYETLYFDQRIHDEMIYLANNPPLRNQNETLNVKYMHEKQEVHVDLTTTHWRLTESKTIAVMDMKDEHIQNCILLLAAKTSALEYLKEHDKDAYELVKEATMERRTPAQWIEIFKLVLQERKNKERIAKARKIKAELDTLKTVEERKADLQKELEKLGFNTETVLQIGTAHDQF
jgi:hypothetical protein